MPNNEDLVAFWGDKNVVSHICFKLGHRAYQSRNKFNYEFSPRQERGKPSDFIFRGG